MRVVYLDQNKWIDIARAVKAPSEFPAEYRVLEALAAFAEAGKIAIPLTSSNLYETHKIANAERRRHLAWVQATLSQGMVFRGRHKRLQIEITDLLRQEFGLKALPRSPNWFLSDLFIEAQSERDDPRTSPITKRLIDAMRQRPAHFLYEYLAETDENIRSTAVQNFSAGIDALRVAIENRRGLDLCESMATRRRLYGARLIINELDLILQIIRSAGLPPVGETEVLRRHVRKIVSGSPTYLIEREIGLRLEAQQRAIEENDFRDMQSFCSVVAYADIVIAENQFSNLAIQSRLNSKYGTHICTQLAELPELLESKYCA